MRLILQRVKSARVDVAGQSVASIGPGLLLFVGFGQEDEQCPEAERLLGRMARKVVQARLFPDHADKLNLSLADTGGQILAVSQFTLHADCRKGRRPSLHFAAKPDTAQKLFLIFVHALRTSLSEDRVQSGIFGALMDVHLHNWGPLTFFWDSQELLGAG
ncbi:MAG TPA: D-tyrosyl-tRNA(Tyr) deacylase [Desulfonatronum sp.]|nr:D-tyrosyl-tRNA(Tyr) deacylase [Desulfonatronum sp.]